MSETLDTHRRALAVNLDPTSYGTFAEIGAGQEVARWFLQVGAAAGTVAKTISAYDMAFSDAIYGQSGRYVSRERLIAMLAHEYPLLIERLGRERGPRSRFFVFADTVSARNYGGTNECHGWMGLRFQTKPGARPNDVLLHVNLRDPTNLQQQQAIGILGVNLVYSAFFELRQRARMLASLFASLSLARIELDFVELSGPAFARADEAALGIELVRQGLATAVVLRGGALVPPTEFLRKRPIVIARHAAAGPVAGSTRRLKAAVRQLGQEHPGLERPTLALDELCVVAPAGERVPSRSSMLRRARQLGRRRAPVLVTRHEQGYELAQYVRRYTREPIVFAFAASAIAKLLRLTGDRARTARGFEDFGRLMGENARMLIEAEPLRDFRAALRRAGIDPASVRVPARGPVRAGDIGLEPPADQLLGYLLGAGWIAPLESRSPRERKPASRKPASRARGRAAR